ncbi:MAG: enoyl-CoA hydratase/isomerase family protein [Deltaproteobacteria bacterium]|nr:enoyl-CoA hydratase/isomerase family protein [Deltaproteobacteria bacterium]MBW1948261.1 enoyl-CoA hydratase/isomerase family protein [Deltaproteobacteria bacterium]MBW2007837.1 enoyl-CoA hydratase/isomerase family protein [Deltaproteobacteria bacterium]MBW2347903.1 enoyl-CoA hydratase/isomerase family protein [Deltaproteobacteria bacterium]
MTFNTLIYKKEGAVGIVTLNRPERLNALSDELLLELGQVLEEIDEDEAVDALIITGQEKFFGAGADIKEIVNIHTPVEANRFAKKVRRVFNKLAELRQPTIAAVSGLALGGGCELALACDVRIAAENASFGLPEIKLGVLPGGGGTQRLPRLVGAGRAKEMLFSGDPIDAQEAYRIGLVNKVVPLGSLMEEAKKMAATFVKRPGYAIKTIKCLVNEGLNMDLKSALAHEARNFEILFSTEDQKEGMKAFLEKRKASFKGR